MPQKPLLFFPKPVPAKRRSPPRGRGGFRKPSPAEQRQRLDAKFRQIAQSFQGIRATVQGLEPEQVLVMEIIGDQVEGLAKAAAQIPGMEWLAEMDLDDVAPQAGFEREKEQDKEKPLPCRFYAVMTSHHAMDRLIGLWNDWLTDPGKRAKKNFGPFKNLFLNLLDLRRWNVEDRIRETGLLENLQDLLSEPNEEIRFEVELWCRHDPQARQRAYEEMAVLVTDAGGMCVAQTAIPDILYHGVLVKMPAAAVRRTVDGILSQDYGPLIRCENVMFFRPFAQARFVADDPEAHAEGFPRLDNQPLPAGDPVVAIFDGLPLECLLVHGAAWGTPVQILENTFRELVNNNNDPRRAWREMDRLKARFLGYGEVLPERALFSTDERVTALGWSSIAAEKGHVYHLPLPPSLGGRPVGRRLTATLAWLTPANPRHRSYRQAHLWCTFPEDTLGVRRAEMDSDTARRGTVEHRVLEGTSVLAVEEGDVLDVLVSCKEDAGGLAEPIPYALAVTLEVAEPLGVSIFDEIRDRIRPRVGIEPQT